MTLSYETLRVACFPVGVRILALSVGAASRREAMPLAQPLVEKALRNSWRRCA